MGDRVEVELVGGPLDGQRFQVPQGQFFFHVLHNGRKYAYGFGDDGKYHHCAEIPSELEQ